MRCLKMAASCLQGASGDSRSIVTGPTLGQAPRLALSRVQARIREYTEAMLSDTDRASLLADLCWHWGEAYSLDTDGRSYRAWRKGYPDDVLQAETAEELRLAIRKDYFQWLAALKERSST